MPLYNLVWGIMFLFDMFENCKSIFFYALASDTIHGFERQRIACFMKQ